MHYIILDTEHNASMHCMMSDMHMHDICKIYAETHLLSAIISATVMFLIEKVVTMHIINLC